eukprot:1890938-Prymnesium_polylepis.1
MPTCHSLAIRTSTSARASRPSSCSQCGLWASRCSTRCCCGRTVMRSALGFKRHSTAFLCDDYYYDLWMPLGWWEPLDDVPQADADGLGSADPRRRRAGSCPCGPLHQPHL